MLTGLVSVSAERKSKCVEIMQKIKRVHHDEEYCYSDVRYEIKRKNRKNRIKVMLTGLVSVSAERKSKCVEIMQKIKRVHHDEEYCYSDVRYAIKKKK